MKKIEINIEASNQNMTELVQNASFGNAVAGISINNLVTISEVPELEYIMQKYINDHLFGHPVSRDKFQLGYNFLKNLRIVLREYDRATRLMEELIECKKEGLISINTYLDIVESFENIIIRLYLTYMIKRRISNLNIFTSGDGSTYERLGKLYNSIKHIDGDFGNGNFPESMTNPLFFDNDKIYCKDEDAKLSFYELGSLINEMISYSNSIRDFSVFE